MIYTVSQLDDHQNLTCINTFSAYKLLQKFKKCTVHHKIQSRYEVDMHFNIT